MDGRACRIGGVIAAAGIGVALSSGIALADTSDADPSTAGVSGAQTTQHAVARPSRSARDDDADSDRPRSRRHSDPSTVSSARHRRAEASDDDAASTEPRTVSRPVETVTGDSADASGDATGSPPPADSPAEWTVLAWTRRQLGDSASTGTDSTAPTVSLMSSTTSTVNVKDFGAVGDGVTDDSAAIKAAEAALTSGARLYFPEGDYRFAQQHPTGNAAVLLKGLSDVTVEFAPGSRLLMDNLDAAGHGTSHGIRVEGAASHVSILNPTIEWVTAPSARSFGDGISVLGWPSDSPPPPGWTGSTGTVQYVTIANARVVNAPQTGAVIMGASDVTVTDFMAVGTKADGLHVNASRRVAIDGLTAIDTGDDGLAFVTYYHPSQVWTYGPTDGPFNQSGLGDWNNSGSSATHVTVTGGRASGVRVQGGRDIVIGQVTVSGKDFGVQVNSAIATGPGDWTSLASRDVDISDVTIDDVQTGIVLATNNIDGTEDPMWWDFSGVSISDVTIHGASNWSVAVETPPTTTSKLAGVSLYDITAETGDSPTGGGNGGILLASLRDSTVDGLHLVSGHAADINILGAGQLRNGVAVAVLPSSNLVLDNVELDGPGRILIQDIAGLTVGSVSSSTAEGAAVVLYRVGDASFGTVTAYLPGRGTGMGRGVQLLQVSDVDITDIVVTMDSHVGSDWWAVELGGGSSAQDIAGTGVRVHQVTYLTTRDDTDSDIVVQGGPYGPVDWCIAAHWLHQGESSPTWRSAVYGDTPSV
ncbi:glycosyl hydrolase family 28-related protein [Mycobacterium sp. PSTR-4-N]|uniref:glycosyl hydrolase family 28-related protein n=1 Tax=Mycobacterium sp. PSTR-4-N TaxID=2917745 RepID=UPI001F15704C|nr:glycosyl hydrolase family 28-related protein [Mycobacterium sp. PSTR-4-N]MCG7592759.1 hypothetical protein [Mycobacterium sp. PSTR-4-N]